MLDTSQRQSFRRSVDKNEYGGFSNVNYDLDWSPDSKWIAYPRSLANHLHALYLYSVDTGQSTQITDEIADSTEPAFDRDGKYLYFLASTNSGATSDGLDMTSDLYKPDFEHLCAWCWQRIRLRPSRPNSTMKNRQREEGRGRKDDEKKDDNKDEKKDADKADKKEDDTPKKADSSKSGDEKLSAEASKPVKPMKVDLAGIQRRIVALPLPAAPIRGTRRRARKGASTSSRIPSLQAIVAKRADAQPLDS